jgi:hypothetical protein
MQKSGDDRRIAPVPAQSQTLLEQITSFPNLERLVPQLGPEVLHKVIATCGLEECAELVAHATPAQLMGVFDRDLWRRRGSGLDEAFDAERFGRWLQMLVDAGAELAAEKLEGIDLDLVIAGMSQHIRVFDMGSVSTFTNTDGELATPSRAGSERTVEVGGYVVDARRTTHWDSIVELLEYLQSDRPDFFTRLMRGCRLLSSDGFEIDGLHDLMSDRDQDLFDLGIEREERRQQQGYVTPADARAFLLSARQLRLDLARPSPDPLIAAYLRGIPAERAGATEEGSREPTPVDEGDGGVDAFVELLRSSGVLPQPPRALLAAAENVSRTPLIEAFLTDASDCSPHEHSIQIEQFAYLANLLAAGSFIQGRLMTPTEASEAAAAICNLGLENWPSRWPDRDLATAFQIGWAVLYRDVAMHTAGRLIDVLDHLRCSDREIQLALHQLRATLARHSRAGTPWLAESALDAIAVLDLPAWASLVGLLAEFPVMHAAIAASTSRARTIKPTDVTFISQNSQIAAIRTFIARLPEILTG